MIVRVVIQRLSCIYDQEKIMPITVEAPEAVGFSAARLARIQPVMQAYVDQRGFSGFSTMLARRGKVIHFEQVGCQDRENQTPMTADTIFRIYSMTKPVICTAFMTLYEEACFQLFDPIAKFIPAFEKLRVLEGSKEAGYQEIALHRPITILDLITHTSGLTYSFLEDSPVSTLYLESQLWKPDLTLEDMTDAITNMPLAFQPGTRWHYSIGIDVIARLIEIVSGQTLQSFLQQRLLRPLGMMNTGFSVSEDKRSHLATMYGLPDVATSTVSAITRAYTQGFNQQIDVEKTYPASNTTSFARGGYGLFSTCSDYMQFAQMLLNRGELDGVRILSPKIMDLMHMNYLPKSLLPWEVGGTPSPGYGFGLGSRVLMNVAESMMPGSVGEFGWGGAAKTYYWIDPQEELIGILMAQYMAGYDVPEKDFQVLVYQALME
jgi:CubicO group peptidase (beta-lactamase class C family)